MFISKANILKLQIIGRINNPMKLNKFNQFVSESQSSLPPEVKLAKLGLSDEIKVIEWKAKVRGEESALLTVHMHERYFWPNQSDLDEWTFKYFDVQAPHGFVEKKITDYAKAYGFDWIHDLDLDTWKKVQRNHRDQ